MAKKILPATPSSYNDIEDLAGLLEDNFHYRSKINPPRKAEYIDNLNLVVGLSFTAVLVRRTFGPTFQSDINRFLDHFSFSPVSECNSIKPIAFEAAKILYEASRFLPKIEGFPELGYLFRKTLEATIRSGLLDTSKNNELSIRLLKTMLNEPYYH